MSEQARATRILTQIDSRSWEHPADRATLNALRKIPGFDEVLRKIFGFLQEKPTRLALLASSVRVSETQYPRVHRLAREAATVLDIPVPPVYVTQSPIYNAYAFGMEQPFVIINSALENAFDDDELRFVLAHEFGHIMSGHVLYLTMMRLLMALAQMGFPIVGLAARAVLMALMEWHRKAELSCDRAGILAVQDPEPGMRTMLKFAGGKPGGTNLDDFVRQAEEYRTTGDTADQVFKVLNLLGATHPFPVLRVAEMRAWFESGAYERILAGDYKRRGDTDHPYAADVDAAAQSYAQGAKETFGGALDTAAEAARRVVDSFRSGFGQG